MSKIFRKKLTLNESFSVNSPRIKVQENQNYITKTNVIGIKGQSYSVCFAAIFLDASDRELGRQVCWITDFSGKNISYQLVFATKPATKNIVLGYRGNIETPVKSDLELEMQEISSLTIEETTLEVDYEGMKKFKIPTLPPLTEEQEEVLEKKISWLCAAPRSGTTWLGTRLLNYKDNIIWHEPWIGFHLGVLRGGLTPAKDFDDASPEKTTELSQIPHIKYNFERILDMQSENAEYFFSSLHKNNWLPALRKLILARTFSHAQTIEKNIIIKDPVGCNGTDVLSECLPKSKIIFLIRDGRDEVDSRIDMHQVDSWAKMRPFKNEKARLDGIAYYSKLWEVNVKNIKKGFDNHNPELRLLVKYEDLISDTFSKLKEIYDFINVKISEKELKKIIELHDFRKIPESEKGLGKFNRSAKIGGWKTNFSEKEKELMNSIMRTTLEEFEYSV